MKVKLILILLLVGFFSRGFASAYEAFRGPTGVIWWDEERAYRGYTLFSSSGSTYLIDMQGSVVNKWNIAKNPRLFDNGHLLAAVQEEDIERGHREFRELDWEGNVLWTYREERENYNPHHDWVRIFNKKLNAYTTMYIANKELTNEECIAAGCNPDSGPYMDSSIDAIVEVDMSGNVVWEWWFFDHVVQDIDPTKKNYVGEGKTISDYPGKLNLNLPGHSVRKDWLHVNSIDYNSDLGHVVVNSVKGEFYVIDHDNTFISGDPQASIELAKSSKGDFLYRFGDPARYGQGDPPSISEDWTGSSTGHKQIGGSHDVQWIKEGLPGAGHFLILNNGQFLFERAGNSYVFEVNPYLGSDKKTKNSYANPTDSGYYTWEVVDELRHQKQPKNISNQVVWIYAPKNRQSFFSHSGSGTQRLANGNTLVSASTSGHVFEVDSQGKVVWEFINPITKNGVVETLEDDYPGVNRLFRAYRYGFNHPALKDRNLSPIGTIGDVFVENDDVSSGKETLKTSKRDYRFWLSLLLALMLIFFTKKIVSRKLLKR